MAQVETKKYAAEMMDSALWCYDHVFGPSLLHVLLELDPAPSREQVVNCVRRTMCQVPLLGFRMERGVWRDRWTPAPEADPESLVEDIEVPEDTPGNGFQDQAYVMLMERIIEPIDLAVGPPIRVMIFRRSERALLVYKLHHSVADGNGCLQVVKLLAENTFKKPEEDMPSPIPMNRSFYQLIKAFGLRDVPGILHDVAVEAVRPWSLLLSKPLWHIDSNHSLPRRLSLARLIIESDDFNRLHDKAREQGLTMNDMLSVALLGLARELNAGLTEPSRYLQVGFTVNLRRFLPEDEIQVTNISGISGVSARSEKAETFEQTATRVREKIGELKRHYIGLGFIAVPQLMTLLMPSRLAHLTLTRYGGFVTRQLLSHSMAMTNVGAMDPYLEAFGHNLKHASFIAPVWEVGSPLITVTGFRGRLSIYVGMLYRSEKDTDLCQTLADRLKYYLLEWCLQ